MTQVEFQTVHGAEWASITDNPAFFAALQLISASKLERIAALSDDEIKEHGATILADYRGHLGVENALIDLAVAAREPDFDAPLETYEDPGTPLPATSEPATSTCSSPFTAFQKAVSKPKRKKRPRKSK